MPATGGSTPHKCGAGYARMTTGSLPAVAGQHPRIETVKNENSVHLGGGSTSRNGGST